MVETKEIQPRHAKILIEALDQEMLSQYPPESNHLDSFDELEKDGVYFVGAYEENTLLGCGAVKIVDNKYGEIKRVFVDPNARGKNIGGKIMQCLEQHLINAGIETVCLETGCYQNGALALYKKLGYELTGPFGSYQEDPYSIYMKKTLL